MAYGNSGAQDQVQTRKTDFQVTTETLHLYPAFVHEPLDPNQPSIRLIQIQPGRPNDAISCKLKHVPLEESHTCLSYIWGVSNVKTPILINDHHYEVGTNLLKFLRVARKLKITDWLWIDALCINQADTDERNKQVRQMSRIYRQAQHVLVWPGDWPKDNPLIPDGLKGWMLAYNGESTWTTLKRYCNEIYMAFERLEYFGRVWIIQELILARERSIILGAQLLRWEDVSRFLRAYSNDLWEDNSTSEASHAASLVHRIDARDREALSDTLNVLLQESIRGRCSEPQDHLYAILGLVDEKGKFPVNYQQPMAQTLMDTLEYFSSVPEVPGGFNVNHHVFNRLAYLNTAFGTNCGFACEGCSAILHGGPLPYSRDVTDTTFQRHDLDVTVFSVASEELLITRTRSQDSWRIPYYVTVEEGSSPERRCGICTNRIFDRWSCPMVQGKMLHISPEQLLVVVYH
jgi:hypothetical protein